MSIPIVLRSTKGFPTVEAIAIPPPFAVVSLETSLPPESVVTPTTTFLSETLNSSTIRVAPAPTINKLPLTVRSFCTVTLPGNVGLFGIDMIGVELSPLPPVTVI